MTKKVLILGVNGQDGILLSDLLAQKECVLYGVGKSAYSHAALNPKVKYFSVDICDTIKLIELIDSLEIEVIYNLAGVSSVAYSFANPVETFEVNTIAIQRLLERLERNFQIGTRFYQASSSEMFGIADTETQDESTDFNPVSPYAESKVETHLMCRAMREKGAFVSAGILFNHESIYRPESFVTRKITSGLARIALGLQNKLTLGNLAAERDWGFAGDYVESMRLIMEHKKPDEFVIATGKKHSILDVVNVAINSLGITKSVHEMIESDSSLMRPKDVKCLVGNAKKSFVELGWSPRKSFEDLISEMAQYDLNILKSKLTKGQDH